MTESGAQPQPGTVVLLGNYRPTLVLARRLGQAGYRVISGLQGCDRGAELSRHVDEVWDHPCVKADRDEFLEALNALLVERPDITCVYPVAEEYVRFFAERRPALSRPVTLAMVHPQTVDACLNKPFMMELARQAGIPIAPFAQVRTREELIERAEAIGFPIVLRPADSTQRLNGEKAVLVRSRDHLDQVNPVWPRDQAALLIQRKAAGIRHNLYFAAVDGKVCRYLHAVITRTDRKDGSGLAVDGKTIAPDPTLRRYTETLAAELDYTGVGCAQFLVDEATGAVSFLEINARIAGNHAVPEHCGLDLGAFLIAVAVGDDIDRAPREGRAEVRYSWLAGDLDGLKSSWRRGELSTAETISWARKVVTTAWGAHLDMMFNWRDPMPGLVTFLDVLPGIGHLTRRRWRVNTSRPDTADAARPIGPAIRKEAVSWRR